MYQIPSHFFRRVNTIFSSFWDKKFFLSKIAQLISFLKYLCIILLSADMGQVKLFLYHDRLLSSAESSCAQKCSTMSAENVERKNSWEWVQPLHTLPMEREHAPPHILPLHDFLRLCRSFRLQFLTQSDTCGGEYLEQLQGGGYNFDSTSIRFQFDAVRLPFDTIRRRTTVVRPSNRN